MRSVSEPMGSVIDSLGVEHTPDEGELVSAAVVLLKVHSPNGEVYLRSCVSEGTSWIETLGMLRAAEFVELPHHARQRDGD